MALDQPSVAQHGEGAATAVPHETCWICGINDANSGEHLIKKSDLRDVLGKPTQAAPFYFHKPGLQGKAVGSLNADILKSSAPMCAHCNNARTQSHDLAWETMSRWFTTRPKPLKKGQFVRGNKIFPYAIQDARLPDCRSGDQAPIRHCTVLERNHERGHTSRSVPPILLR